MKKTFYKGLFVIAFIAITQIALNSYMTSINNSLALLQLEDSNHTLALYDGVKTYGQFALIITYVLVSLAAFKKEIFGGKK
jgi:uncharacterized membrane protein